MKIETLAKDLARVIALAETLGIGTAVIKRPGRDNYNIPARLKTEDLKLAVYVVGLGHFRDGRLVAA